MVIMPPSTVVNRGFEPRVVKPKTIKLVFVVFPLSTKTGWLGITIMYPNEATYLPADCCFSELAITISNQACWSSTKGVYSDFGLVMI